MKNLGKHLPLISIELKPRHYFRKSWIIGAVTAALGAALSSHADNIAPLGTAILGVNNAIDSDAGIAHANAGTTANINDDDTGTHVDNWFGADPAGTGQGVSFVGVLWPTTRYDEIQQVTLYLSLFADGGFF